MLSTDSGAQLRSFKNEQVFNKYLEALCRARQLPFKTSGLREMFEPYFLHVQRGAYALQPASNDLIERLVTAMKESTLLELPTVRTASFGAAGMNGSTTLGVIKRLKALSELLFGAASPDDESGPESRHIEDRFCTVTLLAEMGNGESYEDRLREMIGEEQSKDIESWFDLLLLNDLRKLLANMLGVNAAAFIAETIASVLRIATFEALLADEIGQPRFRRLAMTAHQALPIGTAITENDAQFETQQSFHFLTA